MTQPLDHHPVLLKEVLQGLNIRPDGVYVDGTFGRGGHAAKILAALSDKGRLIVMDKDPRRWPAGPYPLQSGAPCH